MLPSDGEGYPMATVEHRTAEWDGPFDGSEIEPFEAICRRQPTLSFELNWSKTPGCFREKGVIKPAPSLSGGLDSLGSAVPKIMDTLGMRTETLGKTKRQNNMESSIDCEYFFLLCSFVCFHLESRY